MTYYTPMRLELRKLASYDEPDTDIFATRSALGERRAAMPNLGQKAKRFVAPSLVGGGAAYGMSRLLGPASAGGPIRSAAILGTGLYAGHKANQYMNRGNDGQAQ